MTNRSRERSLSAWSVQALLSSKSFTVFKNGKRIGSIRGRMQSQLKHGEGGRSFVIYRMEILRLLNYPKPAHDALIIELPCLMGFRSKEVATWRVEYIHFDSGDCEVLDAKKHRLFTVPLHPLVNRHAEECLDGRDEGYVIQNESTAWRGRDSPLTTTALWYVTRKWAKFLNLYPSSEDYSPIVFRRFFAYQFYHEHPEDLVELQYIMRHSDPETTLRYVKSLVDYGDVKLAYGRFQEALGRELSQEMNNGFSCNTMKQLKREKP